MRTPTCLLLLLPLLLFGPAAASEAPEQPPIGVVPQPVVKEPPPADEAGPASEEAPDEGGDAATADPASSEAETEPAAAGDAAAADPASGEAEAAPAEPLPDTPEAKGRHFAEQAWEANSGFQWSSATGLMVLIDSRGNRSEREFESRVVEDLEAGDLGTLVFLAPPDIAKSALLTIGQKEGDDHQWIYLPALKRVKRISASGKTGAFMGSELTYEDLGSPQLEDYSYLLLAEEPCPTDPALACTVLERKPLDRESGYSRIVSWYDTTTFRIVKSDFYDRKGTLLKTMTADRFELYKERFWRARRLVMQNHVTGKGTEMLWSNFDFDTELKSEDFTTRALERLQ